MNREEIVEAKEYLKETIQNTYAEGKSIKLNNLFQYIEQLENKVRELEEINDKYLQKIVYALTPTTHELSTNNNNAFKKIIADNIDLETCKIRRKLKEFWGVDKY